METNKHDRQMIIITQLHCIERMIFDHCLSRLLQLELETKMPTRKIEDQIKLAERVRNLRLLHTTEKN